MKRKVTRYMTCLGCRAEMTTTGFMTHVRWCGMPAADRFWPKVDKSGGADACWIWKGATCPPSGYGRFAWSTDILIAAHRAAYLLTHNEIPAGLDILHSCDNPPCVNPAHLRAGTHTENMQDKIRRGRYVGGHRPKKELVAA